MKQLIKKVLLLVIILCGFSFCRDVNPQSKAIDASSPQKAKYIFLFIGDGMGPTHVEIAEAYERYQNNKALSFTSFPHQARAMTNSLSGITDSAAAGTALATGQKTANGLISQNIQGDKIKTLVEILAQRGIKTGIVTSVSMDHSTPAVFYAHSPSRTNYYHIAMQAAVSPVDYFGGGPFLDSSFPPGQVNPRTAMAESGWIVSNDPFTIHFKGDLNKRLYTYQSNVTKDALPYSIDTTTDNVSLAEFTEIGIKRLKNPKGFFMMVEGGKIDWASHANDVATMVHEVIAFSDAVQVAIDFYHDYPEETLIVVTADHETGLLDYDPAAGDIKVLGGQKLSFQKTDDYIVNQLLPFSATAIKAEDVASLFGVYFGLTDITPEEFNQLNTGLRSQLNTNYSYYSKYGKQPLSYEVTRIIAQRSGVQWNSYDHSSTLVPVYALGRSAESFGQNMDNTAIFSKILAAIE